MKFLRVKNTEEKTESRDEGHRDENIEAQDEEYIRGTRCSLLEIKRRREEDAELNEEEASYLSNSYRGSIAATLSH